MKKETTQKSIAVVGAVCFLLLVAALVLDRDGDANNGVKIMGLFSGTVLFWLGLVGKQIS